MSRLVIPQQGGLAAADVGPGRPGSTRTGAPFERRRWWGSPGELQPAGSLYCNGLTAQVLSPYVPGAAGKPTSIGIWARRADIATGYAVWGTLTVGGYNSVLRIETASSVTFFPSTAGAASGASSGYASLPPVWDRLWVLYDPSTSRFSIAKNGVVSVGAPSNVAWCGGSFELACRATLSNDFKGWLGPVAIYERFLSNGEVAADARGVPLDRTDLVLEYRMSEGSGRWLEDSSGHGNHGIISATGCSWSAERVPFLG